MLVFKQLFTFLKVRCPIAKRKPQAFEKKLPETLLCQSCDITTTQTGLFAIKTWQGHYSNTYIKCYNDCNYKYCCSVLAKF